MLHLETLKNLRIQVLSNNRLNQADWHQFQNAIYENGIGMEETLKFLYQERPDENQFHEWLKKRVVTTASLPQKDIGDVLTEKDLAFWNEHGYIVVKNAVDKQDAEEAKKAILSFLNVSITNPATWYQHHEAIEGLMVLFTHHPALEKNRTSAKIRRAYEQLYHSSDLIRTTDKVSFNPPETNGYTFKGSAVHWDVSLVTPIPFKLQGLLYLTDAYEDSGAFHCVPGFHNTIESWLAAVPKEINPREYALQTLQPIPITGKAGDFVI
jgi:ectoine hydroxylase-related dioxygenase (phytanoyl-CoA dioxygenase family)